MKMIVTRSTQIKALILLSVLLLEIGFPLGAYALTGGPSQPEVQSFEPVGTSEMVDVFSGDFNYNIPLLDVNGYPVNIAYHAGVTMDQEASWVGLGWNINPGTINRDMRGLPDDMNGENVTKEMNVQDNWTVGLKGIFDTELFGKEKGKYLKGDKDSSMSLNLGVNLGLQYNRYKGMGYSFGSSLNFGDMADKMGLNAGLSMEYDDDGGLSVAPSASMSKLGDESITNKFSVGSAVNSRSGLKGLNMGWSTTSSRPVGEKQKQSGSLQNSSITYSRALPAYTPNISTPMSFVSTDFSFKSGIEIFGLTGTGTIKGTFSSQFIPDDKKSQTKKGYGYLYEQEAPNSSDPASRDYLLDFNRENDGQIMESTPFLPWANHTFDMYSVSAQGVGGSYRLHRNDLSVVHDDYRDTRTSGVRMGFDLASTSVLKGGINLGFNYSRSTSGYWDSQNGNFLAARTGFVKSNSNLEYEPAYFKDVNELTPQSNEFLNMVEGTYLVEPKLAGYSISPQLKTSNPNSPSKNLASTRAGNTSSERAKRNKLFTYRKASESRYCLDSMIKSYEINTKTFQNGKLSNVNSEPRIGGSRKSDHISEIEVLNTDGSRHVFGIPAYNNQQVEKSFRVDVDDADINTGLVGYQRGEDNVLHESANNKKNAIDEYYTATKTPAYAHSYLLTGVLSPDYIDLTGNGISDDDLGSAVKFNYSKVHNNFGWRVPYETNKAKYGNGNSSDDYDDMGNYIYGDKEVWHLHSIEGKTHIALFIMSEREDGLGVLNEDGDKDIAKKMYKLDRIELYSKRELKEYGNDAIPIKTVHFKYNYNLCKGVSNQLNPTTKGKLTLEKIYFTYGKSQKGFLNSYTFDYNESSAQYNLLAYDRWGTYSPAISSTSQPSNAEYPYTNQDPALAAQYASLWNLKQIGLPSGGVINIEYESDDYGYVQDKQAMEMLKITSFGRLESDDGLETVQTTDKLYEASNGNEKNQTDVVIFALDKALPTTSIGTTILQNEYLKDIDQLQVTVNTNITKDEYEYIKTYVTPIKVENKIRCGVMPDGLHGWVQIKKERIRDPEKKGKEKRMVNPIAMAGWEYTRMNLSFLINPGSDRKRNETQANLEILSSFLGFFNEIATMAAGPYRMLMERNFCQNVDFDKSWIRLNSSDKTKLGGGHRVKKIVMNDSWEDINTADADAKNSYYGQEYEYKKFEQNVFGDSIEISSGVASYEPFIGRDENPFVQPLPYDQNRPGVPDDRYTFEHPVAESFFPGASVGYSRIKVKSIDHAGQSKQHRTGYQISEFYTYKDYPVLVEVSAMDALFPPKLFGSSLLAFGADKKEVSAAQGFIIKLNDMHGKPKSNWSFNENDTKISGVSYKYKEVDGELNNDVLAIDKSGDIASATMGVNVDFTADSRYMNDVNFSGDADINLDVFAAGFVPLFIPTVWPDISFGQSMVKTFTILKVVRRTGLLESTTAYKEGSEISTHNMLYDSETGDVLLTSVDNEFGKKVYSFNYPAHWAYDEGMGLAFRNWGLEVKGLKMDGGTLVSTSGTDLKKYLFPGDICMLKRPGKYQDKKVWVNKTTTDDLVLIDEEGVVIYDAIDANRDNNTSLRILHSGRKNMASVSIGSVTCLENPMKQVGNTYNLDFNEVLATSAVEYKDEWRTDMSLFARYDCDTSATQNLSDALAQINSKITANYFLDSSIRTEYGLAICDTFCDSSFTFNSQTGYCERFDTFTVYNEPYQSGPNNHSAPDCPVGTWKSININNTKLCIQKDSILRDSSCCQLNIKTGNYPTKDILEIISHRPKNEMASYLTARVKNEFDEIDTIDLVLESECDTLYQCETICKLEEHARTINPFTTGIRGNWRPYKSWTYVEDRKYNASNPNPSEDGTFDTYYDFWASSSNGYIPSGATNSLKKWVWTSEVTEYSPFGMELENMDPLGRYSAALYGYANTLPIAVASNTRHRELWFEGFEEYTYRKTIRDEFICPPWYEVYTRIGNAFKFYESQQADTSQNLDHKVSHSGNISLVLQPNDSLVHEIALTVPFVPYSSAYLNGQYITSENDQIIPFRPKAGKYVLGMWVREEMNSTDTLFENTYLKVEYKDAQGNLTSQLAKPSGLIIEGWQRVEVIIEIPTSATQMTLKYISTNNISWFDDVRIFPYNGSMKSYAYDYRTLRLMAELDENNYATFYEYDVEGNLVRIKKETERGIKTLQESRQHQKAN